MIASMTGFGKGEAHCDNPACNVTAEITSVNRKQLEPTKRIRRMGDRFKKRCQ